jgi:hypothetical protein
VRALFAVDRATTRLLVVVLIPETEMEDPLLPVAFISRRRDF